MEIQKMPFSNQVAETRDDHIGYKSKPNAGILVSGRCPDDLMYPAAMCDPPGLYVNADTTSRARHLNQPYDDVESRKEYVGTMVKSLQTKGGLLRNDIMGARVEGSCRLTISPSVQRGVEGPNAGYSEVVVPSFFADQVKIPSYSGGFRHQRAPVGFPERPTVPFEIDIDNWNPRPESEIKVRALRTGDTVIVIRQPTLDASGLTIAKVRVEDSTIERIVTQEIDGVEHRMAVGTPNFNSSLRIPLSMCPNLQADYDGDECTLIAITSPEALSECKRVVGYGNNSYTPTAKDRELPGYKSDIHSFLKEINNPITDLDLLELLKVGRRGDYVNFKRAQWAVGLRPHHIQEYRNLSKSKAMTPKMLYDKTTAAMHSSLQKVSVQRSVGNMSRLSKCAPSMYQSPIGYCTELYELKNPLGSSIDLGTPMSVSDFRRYQRTGKYWSPAVRAISALTRGAMQGSLNKKIAGTEASTLCTPGLVELDIKPSTEILEGAQHTIVLVHTCFDNNLRMFVTSEEQKSMDCTLKPLFLIVDTKTLEVVRGPSLWVGHRIDVMSIKSNHSPLVLAKIPAGNTTRRELVLQQGFHGVINSAGIKLDLDELEALFCIVMDLTARNKSCLIGDLRTFSGRSLCMSQYVSPLSFIQATYFDNAALKRRVVTQTPEWRHADTMFEAMLLGNFSGIPSILDS